MKKLLRDLCLLQSVTTEPHLFQYIKTFLDELRISYNTLPHGDILVGSQKPDILFTASVDELGFEILKLHKDGTVQIKNNDVYPWQWVGRDVQIRTKHQALLHGLVISSKTEKINYPDLFIDLGLINKKQLEQYGVEEGCKGTYSKNYIEQGEKIFAHSLGNRVCVWALLTLIKKFQSSLKRSRMAFAFISQTNETKTINKLKPSHTISLDTLNLSENINELQPTGPYVLTKTPDYELSSDWEEKLSSIVYHPLVTKSKFVQNSSAKRSADLGISNPLHYLFPITGYTVGANSINKKNLKQSMQSLEKLFKNLL